ncbi:hypothetical protein [Falsiroseomonas oryzae]|uniref:hypothetical protein n=1 Tax=Falsiroseomonas oryzae TaxID=2766473 RepID=UPI0022EA3789|nr:hypothetical protein [Roseomonas sp. MO-31]
MNRRALLLGSLALPALAGCASVQVDGTTTLVAVVETVDPAAREILLRGNAGAQSGALLTMVAGRAVTRLDQIRPGDRVTVRYYQALAARVARPFSSAPTAVQAFGAERDAERPGGEVTRVRSGRVTITAVDPAANSVSFIGPNGLPRTVVAQNPEVASFVRGLRAGEQVDIVYEEALAISVDPMR